MLQPARTKYRKQMKGRMGGLAFSGNSLTVGNYGIQALERCRITPNQIEAARRVIVRETQRKGKLWLRIFPDKPITKKPAETRMGSGKGDIDHYVAIVKPGRVIFELSGVSKEIAKTALEKAAKKLPIHVRFLIKSESEV
ncbi:50S ribosomal protein L16 [bacterium]|nr:MAG: 50S ribosomal protein L16 [bacterium]